MVLSGNLCLFSDVWDLGWEDRGGVWQGEQLGSVRLESLRGIFTHEFGGWCRLSAGPSAVCQPAHLLGISVHGLI